MDNASADPGTPPRHAQLLTTLEGLLGIQATELKSALTAASQLINDALRADKTDVFLYDRAINSLAAVGTSITPMGQREMALGLDRLPVSNGGKTVGVFQTGEPYLSGHVDQDPDELRGIKEALGIRSAIAVPLEVNGMRRGVVGVDAAPPEHFTADDLRFLQAAAHWVGLVLHRAELVERMAQDAVEQARSVAANELITILAHDLRAPLVTLKGRLLMQRMRAQRDGQELYLQEAVAMQRATDRLERMIADLMDTARLEQGLFTLTPTMVNVADLARETAATLRTSEQEIVVQAPEALVAEVDPDRVRQLLENLLTNAQRHSPQGMAVILEVSTETHADGVWAVLTVRDFGPGIVPELLPTLFARFAAGRGTKGLGLGLYLAHGIAEAHGGTLTVSSAPGEGATFRLALPLPKLHS